MESAIKRSLLGLNSGSIRSIIDGMGLPAYVADQLADWIYRRDATGFGGMSNISKKLRERLDGQFTLSQTLPAASVTGGGVVKYGFPALSESGETGGIIETVSLRHKGRNTACLSTQIGCRFGCRFCRTGEMGFCGNLGIAAILNQLRHARRNGGVGNIVLMGMGEPLDNPSLFEALEIMHGEYGYGARRITVSTVGLLEPLKRFFDMPQRYRLALSLHNPIGEERAQMVPAERKNPVSDVIRLICEHGSGRRVTLEYTLIDGYNDREIHAEKTAFFWRALQNSNIESRVNLIACHSEGGREPQREVALNRFRERLVRLGANCRIRISLGEEIRAACGMLGTPSEKNG